MIFTGALLLFVIYGSVFSQDAPSQACIDVQMALNSNRACQQAILGVGQLLFGGSVVFSDLETYCTPSCLDLAKRLEQDCVS